MFGKGTPLKNDQGQLTAFFPRTDLVLVYSVSNLGISERPTVGRALKHALMFGAGSRVVTARVYVNFLAFKRDPESKKYVQVWSRTCMVPTQKMHAEIRYDRLVQQPDQAKALWDDAAQVIVDECGKALEMVAT